MEAEPASEMLCGCFKQKRRKIVYEYVSVYNRKNKFNILESHILRS
jgi:uncharacterized protein YcgL (UPF0745 family)